MANKLIQLKDGNDNAYPNVQPLFKVTNPVISVTISAGGAGGAYSEPISESGYSFLGVVGWGINNGNLQIAEYKMTNDSRAYAYVRNVGSTEIAGTITAYVLWIRNS